MEAGGRLHPSMPALQWLELGVGLELSFLYISICYLCSRRALIFLSKHSCLDSLIVGMRSDRSELRKDKSCTASAGQRNMLGAKSANSEAAVNRIYMQGPETRSAPTPTKRYPALGPLLLNIQYAQDHDTANI